MFYGAEQINNYIVVDGMRFLIVGEIEMGLLELTQWTWT